MSVVPFPTTDSQPTRFLFVSNIPQDALTDRLKQTFIACGDLNDIFVTFQAKHGAKILAFDNVVHSLCAHRAINDSRNDIHFQARFITSEELDSPIVQHFFGGFRKQDQAAFANATDSTGHRLYVKQCLKTSTIPVECETEAREEHNLAKPGVKKMSPFPPTSPLRTLRRLSVDSALPLLPHTRETGQRPRHTSNTFHFDSIGKSVVLPTSPRSRSVSLSKDTVGLGFVDAFFSSALSSARPLPSSAPNPLPKLFIPKTVTEIPCLSSPRHPPKENRIDITRIERGDDKRTSVMIKNIPNKMRREELVEFIQEVCPRKIDFVYLRVDFANGCNIGYDLLHFVKAKLGKKWNLFKSDKTLGMTYANYQGKEALMERLRSSPIMEQREEWRPKLFHSDGARCGLPQDCSAWEYGK